MYDAFRAVSVKIGGDGRMTGSISRLQLLRGGSMGRETPIRPPFALSESAFIDACERSNACVKACPEKILVRSPGGFPELDFTRGACTFCYDCVKACPNGALDRAAAEDASALPWSVTAEIGAGCLAQSKVMCRSCGDRCGARAVRFRLVVGGAAIPEIDRTACNGCGACVTACPSGAVRMAHRGPAAA